MGCGAKKVHGNEKGIAVKIVDGTIVLDIDDDFFNKWLALLPKDEDNTVHLAATPRYGLPSFSIEATNATLQNFIIDSKTGIVAIRMNTTLYFSIDPFLFTVYRKSIPKSYKNWIRLALVPIIGAKTYSIEPVYPNKPESREVKITGPDAFKQAG